MAALVLTVAGVTLVGDRAVGCGGTRLLMQSQIRFSRLYAGDLGADVLILGNSRAVNTLFAPALEEGTRSRVRSLAWNGLSAEIAEVFAALTKWWNMDMMNTKPVIEVLPKRARVLQCLEFLVGGYDYPGI